MTNSLDRAAIQAILDTGSLSRIQYLQLMSTILSGQNVDDDDYRMINQVFDRFRLGRISIADS